MNGKINKVEKKLLESGNLTVRERLELSWLMDKAKRALESFSIDRLISILNKLIGDIGSPEIFTKTYRSGIYIKALDDVIRRLSTCKRKNDFIHDPYKDLSFDDYSPINVKTLLESLGELEVNADGKIIITPKQEDLLNKDIDVYTDDGMGYSPNGSNKVFCSYLDNDSNNLSIWV